MKTRNPYNLLRWAARIISILMVAFTLFIFIGEFFEGRQRNPGYTYSPIILTMFVFWGIALAGLILGLWKEGLGGIISLTCYILVYILNLFNKEVENAANGIFVFLILSIPSILYLIYWKLNKDELRKSDISKSEIPA